MKIRAVGLLSGGLDSALAARLMIDQGIDVLALHLESPTACRSDVREVARELGIPLEVRPKGEEYIRLLRHPRFGYGRNMNPCVDCRIFMFQLGRPYLEEFGAQFLFTGEVLGQRPMSQMRAAMKRIDRESGLEGWIVRPLSARLLAVTEPERLGWLERDRLLDIWGRGRSRQIELAERYGLRHYQSPGGGCLLTDPQFAKRLEDLFEHAPEDRAGVEDVALLRVGRHIRVSEALKIVLGRNAGENRRLADFESPERWLVEPAEFSGPTALVCGAFSEEALAEAVRLIARYSRALPDSQVAWRAGERSGSVRIDASRSELANGDGHPIQVAAGSSLVRITDTGS
jgi:tRNA U34 2-thiouridine synthase MnmA/TrmU